MELRIVESESLLHPVVVLVVLVLLVVVGPVPVVGEGRAGGLVVGEPT